KIPAPDIPPHEGVPTGTTLTLPIGAMGVLAKSGQDVALWFPAEELPGFDPHSDVPGTYTIPNQLVAFNDKGVQARFNPQDLQLTRWCTDDKGPVYRLQALMLMPAPPPDELLISREDGIIAFVMVGDAAPVGVSPPMGTKTS